MPVAGTIKHSYNFVFTLGDAVLFIGILTLIYLFYRLYRLTRKRKKKLEEKYFRVKNRAQLLSEITIGLKIISNLKTLIFLGKLTDPYLDKNIKRLEKIVLCYDSRAGIETIARIHRDRHNDEMLKLSLSLLELEFRKT